MVRSLTNRTESFNQSGTSLGSLFGATTFAQSDHVAKDDEVSVSRYRRSARMLYCSTVSQTFGAPSEIRIDDRFGSGTF